MRISRRLLNDAERPVLITRTHPIRLVGPVVRAATGVAVALAVGYYTTPQTGTDQVDLVAAAVALLVLAWATKTGKVGRLLDSVLDHISSNLP
jgi:hypothetical protein